MTHPKQLENVARAICSLEYTSPIDVDVNWNRYVNMAQAAIEAASRPLPIEDAPKDGTQILVFAKDVHYPKDQYTRVAQFDLKREIFMQPTGATVGHNFLTGWLPIPTQEGE